MHSIIIIWLLCLVFELIQFLIQQQKIEWNKCATNCWKGVIYVIKYMYMWSPVELSVGGILLRFWGMRKG